MRVQKRYGVASILIAAFSIAAAGCGAESATVKAAAKAEPPVIDAAPVDSRSIDRYLRVTGSLVADEQAEVSAEAAGRVVAVSVERGTHVAQGAVLVRISGTETSAQLQEAEANAAQIEARLGLSAGQSFDPKRVRASSWRKKRRPIRRFVRLSPVSLPSALSASAITSPVAHMSPPSFGLIRCASS